MSNEKTDYKKKHDSYLMENRTYTEFSASDRAGQHSTHTKQVHFTFLNISTL